MLLDLIIIRKLLAKLLKSVVEKLVRSYLSGKFTAGYVRLVNIVDYHQYKAKHDALNGNPFMCKLGQ